jgi:hypothetical protein
MVSILVWDCLQQAQSIPVKKYNTLMIAFFEEEKQLPQHGGDLDPI